MKNMGNAGIPVGTNRTNTLRAGVDTGVIGIAAARAGPQRTDLSGGPGAGSLVPCGVDKVYC